MTRQDDRCPSAISRVASLAEQARRLQAAGLVPAVTAIFPLTSSWGSARGVEVR